MALDDKLTPDAPPPPSERQRLFAPFRDAWRAVFNRDKRDYALRVTAAWVVVFGLLGLTAWSLVSNRNREYRSLAWTAWVMAEAKIETKPGTTAAEYQELADRQRAEPKLARWARLKQAEAEMFDGLRDAYGAGDAPLAKTDRIGRNSDLRDALKMFEDLTGGNNDDLFRERVLYGLAICTEATCDGSKKSIDKAIAAYSNLKNNSTLYEALADRRIAVLGNSKGDAVSFYKWFKTVEPRTEEPQAGSGTDPTDADRDDKIIKGLLGTKDDDPSPPPGAKDKTDKTDKTDKKEPAVPKRVIPGNKDKPDKKKPDAKKKLDNKKKKPNTEKPAKKKTLSEKKKPAAKTPAKKTKPEKKKPAAKKPAKKKPLSEKKKAAAKKKPTKKKLESR